MSSSIRSVPVALRAIELFNNYRSAQLNRDCFLCLITI
jgi:hypothetical protein